MASRVLNGSDIATPHVTPGGGPAYEPSAHLLRFARSITVAAFGAFARRSVNALTRSHCPASTAALSARRSASSGAVTGSGAVLNLCCAGGVSGPPWRPWHAARSSRSPCFSGVSFVPRDGIEPPTRGFSMLRRGPQRACHARKQVSPESTGSTVSTGRGTPGAQSLGWRSYRVFRGATATTCVSETYVGDPSGAVTTMWSVSADVAAESFPVRVSPVESLTS